ncbi:GntR family transcriptional regulator [Chitinasiproducens palmae]|uniref:DNA-binding transcriptional regulator, GntR family n=1 Tax=Chitinasiproducens palmae TaxID=1770053 RepID=A0A1H2PQ39_9BURK|nr:GntR family transcriptional regulator [Chitinasiproducens palmae]SDV48896.1 DNA-binding transcriptional regulator, GntR family [Chitinasiproducens palmae]
MSETLLSRGGAAELSSHDDAATPASAPRVARAHDIEVELRRRIARQILLPGAVLREGEIAEEFGVSRTQVRDAFLVLALRGLIERVPNKGAVVSRLDFAQIVEIFAVREPLEGMCARLAAQNTTPEVWQPFVERFEHAMPGFVETGDFDAFADGYQAFRLKIIESANNRTLRDMLDSIGEKINALSRRIIILPGRGAQALLEHRAVLDALYRGDAEAAETLRKANMRSGLEWFVRYRNFVL